MSHKYQGSFHNIAQAPKGCLALFLVMMLCVTACTSYFSANDPTLIIAPAGDEMRFSEKSLTYGIEKSTINTEYIFFDEGTFTVRLKTSKADTTFQVTLKEGKTVKIANQQGYSFTLITHINK
jgi:hypothetical protein